MKRNRMRLFAILLAIICVFSLSSCSSEFKAKTSYLAETSSSGCGKNPNYKTKYDWLISQIEKDVDTSLTDSERLYGKVNEETNEKTPNYLDNLENLIKTYVDEKSVAESIDQTKIDNNFRVMHIREDNAKFLGLLSNIKTSDSSKMEDLKVSVNQQAGCLDTKSEKTSNEALANLENETDVYRMGALYMIQIDLRLAELEPITFKASSFGEFMSNIWGNLFIFPVAWLLFTISKLAGGFYVVGLIITTIIVRTLGWPIYAKTNDMSLKMGLMNPEIQAIQEKYAGRQDPDSRRMMQMEQAQLYKKYGVGLSGCLAPLIQFPIFMTIFQTISRMPYTKAIEGSSTYTFNWANELNSTIFGVDLFAGRQGGGTNQLIGVIIIIFLVVGTQILTQVFSQAKQKKASQKSQEDIPAYRRQAYNQTQNSTQNTMKIMLWVMVIMMGVWVWTSKAGLGVYWLIGNLYSMLQMVINSYTSEKRLEKLKRKHSNSVYTIKK